MLSSSFVVRGVVLVGVAAAATGCTFQEGGWFAVIDPSLSARHLELPERDAGNGWQTLGSGFEVKLEAMQLHLGELELVDVGAGGGSFDPANPPPGYSNCHNGHCHDEHGGLVSYEEIEAELAGGEGARPVLHLLSAGEMELLPGFEGPLECEGGCGIGEARIRQVRAPIAEIGFAGSVRDTRVPARITGEVPWTAVVTVAEGDGHGEHGEGEHVEEHEDGAPSLEGALDLPADRAHAPDVRLALSIEPTAAIFDEIDFAALVTTSGALDFAAPGSAEQLEHLLEGLESVVIEAEVSR